MIKEGQEGRGGGLGIWGSYNKLVGIGGLGDWGYG